MAIFGRSFPTHPFNTKAGQSNYFVTLNVASPTFTQLTKQAGKIFSIVETSAPVINTLKLKALINLSIASSTVTSLATRKGSGMIMSVVSIVGANVNRNVTKGVAVGTPGVASMQKAVGKGLGTSSAFPTFIVGPTIVINNWDGGIKGPPNTNVLIESTIDSVVPGLFRIAPPKGGIKVQFRPFVIKLIKRIRIP